MPDSYFNPFQAIDIVVPIDLHKAMSVYCQTSGNFGIDKSPFPRLIDMWFVALGVAARLGLKPEDISRRETVKIIDGSIFTSDSWRVRLLMLLAIGYQGDVDIVREPRKMMALASGLAVAGLPKVIEMLSEGSAEPIWNLSEALVQLLDAKVSEIA